MIGRIWLLSDPVDDRFASAARVGTWRKIDGKDVRVSPLVLEWQRGSKVVGDFLWPSFEGDVVAVERVFRELQERFGGLDAGPIRVIPPKWKRRKELPEGVLTIWSEDLHLVDVWFAHRVDWDWDKSCIRTTEEDDRVIHEVIGGENTEVDVDPETFDVRTRRIPRVEGGGIFVKANLLQGHSFFKVNHDPVWNLCTDAARDFILEKEYTNIDFFHVGELF